MNDTQYNLKIIVLAAGKSERFKAIKLVAQVKVVAQTSKKDQPQSTSLIQHVLQQILASLSVLNIEQSNLHVATGGFHQQISEVLGKQYSIINCPDAHLGLGHTIAQSVERILSIDNNTEIANSSHIMITLADQVALTTDDYIRLIEQSLSMPGKLICAKVGSELMPPAIFPQSYFNQLMNLTGDKGAKALLHQNKENLQEVLLANAAIDIDTQQDLINWHKSNTLPL